MNVSVNGQHFMVPDGASINVNNGVLFVNGQPYRDGEQLKGRVHIEVTGGLASLTVRNGDATIHGDVAGDVDAGGSVQCGEVKGKVDAGGSVQCGDVGGDVDAGGSVKCQDVTGSVDAGGSVRCSR